MINNLSVTYMVFKNLEKYKNICKCHIQRTMMIDIYKELRNQTDINYLQFKCNIFIRFAN